MVDVNQGLMDSDDLAVAGQCIFSHMYTNTHMYTCTHIQHTLTHTHTHTV